MTTLRSLKPPASNLPGDLIQEILSLVSCMWLVPYGQKRVVIRKDLMASLHQSPTEFLLRNTSQATRQEKQTVLKTKTKILLLLIQLSFAFAGSKGDIWVLFSFSALQQ